MAHAKHERHERHERHEMILFKEECNSIQEAFFEVYCEIGCFFLGPVYQECMEKEFSRRGIPPVVQQKLNLMYKSEKLQPTYKPDLIC